MRYIVADSAEERLIMTSKKQTFKAAAKKLLSQAGEPMTPKELTALAMEEGLLETEGQTPEATMAAQLYVDVRRNPKSLFKKVGQGKFALRQQTESAASPQLIIEKQNELVRTALKKQLHEMDAYQFEFLISDLLQALGYENVGVTRQSGDGGIDVIADLTLEGITNVRTVVQVKRFKEGNNIPGRIVAQLRGSAEVDQRGLIIATSDFTKDAIAEAKAPNKMPVSLVNGEKLIELLIKHKVGVKAEAVSLYSIDNQYFENVIVDKGKRDDGDKSRGLWPLPGGTTAYAATLLELLGAIDKGLNTKDKLVGWFLKTFESVSSEKTAAGYVNVPRTMGFVTASNGKFSLTPEGKQALQTRELEYIYRVFASNVFGIDEIMVFLNTSGTAQSPADIMEFLAQNHDVEWTTLVQVNFRLYWLQSLGKIKKTLDGWEIVPPKRCGQV